MTRTLIPVPLLIALTACAVSPEFEEGPRTIDLAEQEDVDVWDDELRPEAWRPLIGASQVWYGRWRGESANDRLGISVANGGDLNDDGQDDVILGSLYGAGSATNDGAAYVLEGPSNGLTAQTTAMDGRFLGSGGIKAGQVVGAGGDVTGDGVDDFVMGAVSDATNNTNAGAAYVIAGGIGGENDVTSVGVAILGVEVADRVGQAVDIVGDLNSDGVDDLIITGSGVNDTANGLADAGAAFLFYGPVTSDASTADANLTIYGSAANQQLGTRVSGLGDHDGDGVDDFIVTARYDDTNGTDAGAAFIFTAEAGAASAADAAATLLGVDEGDAMGNQVSDTPFDLNDDGYTDVLIGALGAGSQGKGDAYVFYGPLSGTLTGADFDIRFFGQQLGDQFGASLAAGDLDEDGDVDIFVGANRHTTDDRGAGYIYLDPVAGTYDGNQADVFIRGSARDAYFGSWAAIVPGADGSDGGDILVVGESNRGNGSFPQRGIVYFFGLPL